VRDSRTGFSLSDFDFCGIERKQNRLKPVLLSLGLPVSDSDSPRSKIGRGHVHEYDMRALALGAGLFHKHLRNALGDFALLVDCASFEPCDVHVWHFSILLKDPTNWIAA
jgi:hypothetical protein